VTKVFTPGDILASRYKIERYLDAGSMQEVYVARDLAFDRTVVVKVPMNESATKRFEASAQLSAQLNHPNIAKTLDYIPGNDFDVLVEEFVEGPHLRDFLSQFERVDPQLVGHIFHSLAKGVRTSHTAGIYHRDLKPSNVLTSGEAWPALVKITDFGVAKRVEDEFDAVAAAQDKVQTLVGSKTLVGAIAYMSPEVVDDPGDAGPASDVWALGAVAYELLTGEPPFGSKLAAIQKILNRQPPPAPQVPTGSVQFKGLVDALFERILRCLDPDVPSRITADELVEATAQIAFGSRTRSIGTIRTYGGGYRPGNWGFISHEGQDVFFHRDSYYGGTPSEGTKVAFVPVGPRAAGRAPRAHPVVPLKDNHTLFGT